MEVVINFKGVELKIEGNFEKGEERVYYDSNGDGYPGSEPYFEASTIYLSDSEVDIVDLFDYDDIVDIEDLCLMAVV